MTMDELGELGEQELEQVEAALAALARGAIPMTLSEFDGLCAGLALYPEIIDPDEWLPLILGPDETAEDDDPEAATDALAAVVAHLMTVSSLLQTPGLFVPLLDEDIETGEVMWDIWVSGFMSALDLRPDVWKDIERCGDARTQDAARAVAQLCAVANDLAEGKRGRIPNRLRGAHELIPALVDDLYAFAHGQPGTGPVVFPQSRMTQVALPLPDGRPKVGRNDPCPCGSGKKYKKCCGAPGASAAGAG